VHPDEARELATAERRALSAAAVERGLKDCGVIDGR